MTYSLRVKKFAQDEAGAYQFFHWMKKTNPHTHPEVVRYICKSTGNECFQVEWEVKEK